MSDVVNEKIYHIFGMQYHTEPEERYKKQLEDAKQKRDRILNDLVQTNVRIAEYEKYLAFHKRSKEEHEETLRQLNS